jgi:aminopeptidase N
VRGALGPEALLRGLQALAERGAEGPVGSLDLAQCLTAAHGQPLPIVWEQWTTAPGSPTFDVSWTHDERAGEVVLRVRQVQDGESGTPRAYRLPVEVELAVGPRTEVHRLELGQRSESLRLKVASRPRWVRFDRAGWIPGTVLEQKSVDEWFAIVADRGDPRGRMRALEALLGRALAEREADRSLYLTQFGGRLERDESPRVRRAAALGLGQLGGEAAVRWLARSAEQDTEWRVRAAALEGLRAHARTSLVDLAALAERRLERDPEVAAEALALRAAADPVTASSYLRSTWARRAETPVRVAVVQVLAQVEQARSEPWLREVAADGLLPVAVRAAALEALGLRERAAPETVELLGQLLGSEAGAVREAALESLGRLDGEDARRLLEAHAAQTAEPAERRAIEAALARRR